MLNVTAAILRRERGSPCPYQLSSTGSSRLHTDTSTLIIFYPFDYSCTHVHFSLLAERIGRDICLPIPPTPT